MQRKRVHIVRYLVLLDRWTGSSHQRWGLSRCSPGVTGHMFLFRRQGANTDRLTSSSRVRYWLRCSSARVSANLLRRSRVLRLRPSSRTWETCQRVAVRLRFQVSESRFTVHHSVLGLLWFAYNVRNDQVSAAPPPLDHTMYDVDVLAQGHDALTKDEFRTLLKQVLGERFALKVHRESRLTPVLLP